MIEHQPYASIEQANTMDALFRQLKHKAMAVIQTTDGTTFQIIDSNEQLRELSGFAKEELLAVDPISLLAETPLSEMSKNLNILIRKQYFKTEAIIYTANQQKMIVDLELHPLESPCENLQLAILDPICTRKWIQQQLSQQQVLVSGILTPELVIDLYDPYFDEIFDHKMVYENLSIFDFISELDHSAIRQALGKNFEKELVHTMTLRTTPLKDKMGLELKITARPFYNGSGRILNYGFLITELKPSDETNQPAIKLKIFMAQRSISAQALSEATGITIQTISKLRNGKITRPQRLTAQLIAAELGVAVSDIWPETGK